MKIETFDGDPIPEELIAPWEGLLEGSSFPTPFFHPLWHQTWMRHFGRPYPVKIMAAEGSGEDLMGLGIFFEEKKEEGRDLLQLLGAEDVYDYRDVITAAGKEEKALESFVRFWGEGPWDELHFSGISELSPTRKLLPRILNSGGFEPTEALEEVSVFLDLPPTWEEFLGRMKSKDRHELRRKMRRLEKEASFEVTDLGGEPLARRMDLFLSLHRKSTPEKAGFMTPQMEGYFRDLAGRLEEKGWLKLSFLKIEGKGAAGFFAFRFRQTEYIFNSGYDPQFARLSPGIVLTAHTIQKAMEDGMRIYHFLRGGEEYKYHLGGKEERIYRLRAVRK